MDRLSAMRALVRVVETGSFSAAGRQLRIGQPAVSRSVAQLEARLGVPLLLRSSRKLTLTEAGRGFFEHAKRSLEEADEADLAARGAGAAITGKLRFAAAVTFARLAVIPTLPVFLAEHPGLQIEAILDDRNVDLIEEGIDVALRIGKLADSTHLARRIGQCARIVVGTPAYFQQRGRPHTPADLASHPTVVYTQGGGGQTWRFQAGDGGQGEGDQNVTLVEGFRTNAAEGVREAVFAGLGLCVSSEWMFGQALAQGRVERVLPHWTLPPLDLWAMFPNGRRPSAKARAFVTFVEAQLRAVGFAPP